LSSIADISSKRIRESGIFWYNIEYYKGNNAYILVIPGSELTCDQGCQCGRKREKPEIYIEGKCY
jgi:hypothetical protein